MLTEIVFFTQADASKECHYSFKEHFVNKTVSNSELSQALGAILQLSVYLAFQCAV